MLFMQSGRNYLLFGATCGLHICRLASKFLASFWTMYCTSSRHFPQDWLCSEIRMRRWQNFKFLNLSKERLRSAFRKMLLCTQGQVPTKRRYISVEPRGFTPETAVNLILPRSEPPTSHFCSPASVHLRQRWPTGCPRAGFGPRLHLLRPTPSLRFIFQNLNFTTVIT
jgi:hypothetical protein